MGFIGMLTGSMGGGGQKSAGTAERRRGHADDANERARAAALDDLAGTSGDMQRTTAAAFAPQQAAPPQAPPPQTPPTQVPISPEDDEVTARTRAAFGRAPVRPY